MNVHDGIWKYKCWTVFCCVELSWLFLHHKIFRILGPHSLNAANSPHGHCDNLKCPSDFCGSSTEPLKTTGLLEEDTLIEYTEGLRVRGWQKVTKSPSAVTSFSSANIWTASWLKEAWASEHQNPKVGQHFIICNICYNSCWRGWSQVIRIRYTLFTEVDHVLGKGNFPLKNRNCSFGNSYM